MRRSIVAVMTALLVLGMAGTASSEQPDGLHADRFKELADRKDRTSPTPSTTPDRSFTAAGCWSHPADPAGDGRADIVEWCADYQHDALHLRLRTRQPTNPLTDSNWNSLWTGALWGIDVNGDDRDDYAVLYVRDGGRIAVGVVHDASGSVTCTADGGFDGQFFTASIGAHCIGGVASAHIDAFMIYDTNPNDPDAPVWMDLTPRQRVTRGTPAAPPPPAPAPAPGAREVTRLAGSSRFHTAVEISRYQFPDGAAEVYLANGGTFPDALAGGSLTRGPVLLVPGCGALPDVVRDEIRRLDATRVIGLGGGAAVCDDMLRQASEA